VGRRLPPDLGDRDFSVLGRSWNGVATALQKPPIIIKPQPLPDLFFHNVNGYIKEKEVKSLK